MTPRPWRLSNASSDGPRSEAGRPRRRRAILDDVRDPGEAAVADAGARFGGAPADGRLVIGREQLVAAADALPADIRTALDQAIANVRAVAEAQRPVSTTVETAPGLSVERRWLPLRRVGCYVPGGGAPLPSSLVMTVVPALVAGVDEIVVASPAGPSGPSTRSLPGPRACSASGR
jgi:histidinol dehydrogenase